MAVCDYHSSTCCCSCPEPEEIPWLPVQVQLTLGELPDTCLTYSVLKLMKEDRDRRVRDMSFLTWIDSIQQIV